MVTILVLAGVMFLTLYAALPAYAALTFTITDETNNGSHVSGYVGDTITFSGTGFPSNADVLIDGFTTAHTDNYGNFSGSFIFPQTNGADYSIDAIVNDHVVASAPFTLLPSIVFDSTIGHSGDIVTVTGNGFSPYPIDDGLSATFDGGNPLTLNDLHSDGSGGNFVATFTVPNSAPGSYTVTVTNDAEPTISASATFTITPNTLPEYPLGELTALLACFGTFVLFKKRKSIPNLKLRI